MNVPNKILYTAEATVVGGRDGHARSSDGHLDVDLDIPQEMGGAGGPGTNPEQLFAAGFAACFESSLMGAARREKKNIGQVVITNRVGIGAIGGGRLGLAVEMHIHIPGVEHAEAEALVQLADEICPYSNATRGNISVQLIVEDREETLSISR
jgi:osmotically inducible protein OsmC